ncbi:MAG TPA: hypothetical protein VG013_38625 [Gemmataceae bacterium]|nr:hypothetical protein [Gemmataceae bacterium]
MTLNDMVLRKTAEWRVPAGSRQTLAVPDDGCGWAAAVTADRSDDLGCLVWEIKLRRTAAPAAAELPAWAERVAGRVTGLLEPLKVVEVDVLLNEALLRSDQPTQRGDAVFYYEVRLNGSGEATLRRFHAFHEERKPREQILFSLTHEALAKVVGDVAADQ